MRRRWWRSARRTPSQIEQDAGIEFDKWGLPKLNEATLQSTQPKVFFGGDAAFGPKNIIWAAAHGHDAAISIHKMLIGEKVEERPAPASTSSTEDGHPRVERNTPPDRIPSRHPHRAKAEALKDIMAEVELGFDPKLAFEEAQRCLNCDVQTVFAGTLCIECDACVDIRPMDCITFTENGEEKQSASG